jgi:hypothetical protein
VFQVAHHQAGTDFARALAFPLPALAVRAVPVRLRSGEGASLVLLGPQPDDVLQPNAAWLARAPFDKMPEPFAGFAGRNGLSVVAADLDHDGDDDLVVAPDWIENRSGSFAPATNLASGELPSIATAVSDLDRDGQLDLAFVSSYTLAVAHWRDRQFVMGEQQFLVYPTDVAAGQFTCDDLPDLVSLSGGEGLKLFVGGPDGFVALNPAPQAQGEEADAASGLRAGDFDGDGRLDLAQPQRATCDSDTCDSELRIFLAGP